MDFYNRKLDRGLSGSDVRHRALISGVNQTNAFPAGPLRADLTGDPALASSERSIDRWFNTSAFRAPDPFRFGTAGRSILRAPGVVNLDASMIKRFAITERGRRNPEVSSSMP